MRSELLSLLEAKYPVDSLNSMYELSVLSLILPEFQDRSNIAGVELVESKKMKDISRLYWLIRDVKEPKALKSLSKRLKLSQKQERALLFLSSFKLEKLSQAQIMDMLDETDNKIFDGFFINVAAFYFDRLSPSSEHLAQIKMIQSEKSHIRKAPPLLNGDEILDALSIEKGPLLGKLVRSLKDEFRNETISTKEQALNFLKSKLDELS